MIDINMLFNEQHKTVIFICQVVNSQAYFISKTTFLRQMIQQLKYIF